MWSMILLLSRLPGGHSRSAAGDRKRSRLQQRRTVCWYGNVFSRPY